MKVDRIGLRVITRASLANTIWITLTHGREYRTVLARGEGETKIECGRARDERGGGGGYFSLIFRETSFGSSETTECFGSRGVLGRAVRAFRPLG